MHPQKSKPHRWQHGKCVLIENVKALTHMYHGHYAEYVVSLFSDLGYTVYSTVLDAADYGVPQHRERVIFFATKVGKPFAFPKATHGRGAELLPHETSWKVLKDLMGREGTVPNHVPLQHSDRVIARYRLIPEGGRLPPPEELPADIRRKNFGNTYKRLHRKQPSLTMVPGNNAFPIHPTLDRSLTPREAARLQTFPDTFVFEGDRRTQCILVGNAVPPHLSEAVGRAVLRHLRGVVSPDSAATPASVVLKGPKDASRPIGRVMSIEKLSALPPQSGVVDLFSGAGGFTLGFARAGWRPLLGVDNDRSVVLSHQHNYSRVPFLFGDLGSQSVQQRVISMFKDQDVGVVVGGPPCQGFSIFGKRRFLNKKTYDPHKDPRNRLVFAFLDVVHALSPRWVVMENVPGLVSLDSGFFLDAILEQLARIGYDNAEAKILNAADYGVPQLRRRLLVVANRTGHVIPWPKRKFFEAPQDWQEPYRTVGEVIADLAEESSYLKHSCHVPMKHKPRLVERYKYIPEGGVLNVSALPEFLRRGYRTESVKNYSHIFKRLHRDKPAFTMVPGHNAFPVHPWLDRALTVREAARIQTFPDEVEFKGTRQEQCIQVGNAFPPLLAELVANNLRKAEANSWVPGRVPRSAYYALVEKPEEVQLSLVPESTEASA